MHPRLPRHIHTTVKSSKYLEQPPRRRGAWLVFCDLSRCPFLGRLTMLREEEEQKVGTKPNNHYDNETQNITRGP